MSEILFLDYCEKDIGGFFKSSKTSYYWKVKILQEVYNIELHYSKASCKFRVFINTKKIAEECLFADKKFNFNINLNTKNVSIIQVNSGFELYIDNKIISTYKTYEDNSTFPNPKNNCNINNLFSNNNESHLNYANNTNPKFIKLFTDNTLNNHSFINYVRSTHNEPLFYNNIYNN